MCDILEAGGVDSLTVANIARASDLHPNTINYYFNGKTDMLMRFHTYLYDNERRGLPAVYCSVPQCRAEAVCALLQLVDFELFLAGQQNRAFQKIITYLQGQVDVEPQVRHYLSKKQEEHCAFLRAALQRYCAAGIVRADTLEDGLGALTVLRSGYALVSQYRDTSQVTRYMTGAREHIVRMMLADGLEKPLEKALPPQ